MNKDLTMTKTAMRLSLLTMVASGLLVQTAIAHVSLEKDEAEIGKGYKAVLKVPHGCDGEPTIAVKIDIPEGYIGVKPMPKPGWKTETARGPYAASYAYYHGAELKDGVTSVTWSGGELPNDFYDEFVVSGFIARELKPGPLYFKVRQTCAKGEMSWNEIPAAGVNPHSLKSPAASLALVAANAEAHEHDHAAAGGQKQSAGGAQKQSAGGGHDQAAGASTGEAGSSAGQTIGKLDIETAWARATPTGAKVGAGYLTIRNTGTEADALVSIAADVAGRSEVHDMTMVDGVMRMREVADGLAIPPGGSVELKPGGLHIMFLDLKTGLKAGETIKAKLKFKSGAEGEVEFSVAPIGASAPEHKHH
jgi:uncharacterized protein YcnI/copper(I)-binding protein